MSIDWRLTKKSAILYLDLKAVLWAKMLVWPWKLTDWKPILSLVWSRISSAIIPYFGIVKLAVTFVRMVLLPIPGFPVRRIFMGFYYWNQFEYI